MKTSSIRIKRVLIVIKSDGIGGVERQVANLLDAFASRAIHADVVALSPSPLQPGLLAGRRVVVLGSRLPSSPLQRISQLVRLRRLIRRNGYDVLLAFGPSPNALVSLARSPDTLAVIAEVGDPFIGRRRAWNAAMMWTYRRADALIVRTQRLAEEFQATDLAPATIAVSPYTLSPRVPFVSPLTPRSPKLVSIGRLVPSKRVGDLITAFASIESQFPAWTLTILGDGPERQTLERQVADRHLGDRVVFRGFVSEPWRELAQSSIFVLTSAHEGFPNVLIEAAVSGCAVVSSDCRFGPHEILNQGERGLLYPVADVGELATSLARLMRDRTLRDHLAVRLHESVKGYETTRSGDAWIELLNELARKRRE